MRVFVSYRRVDSPGWTGRIVDTLIDRLGKANVFQDVASLVPGDNWFLLIGEALQKVDAVVVVIGPTWLTVTDEHGHRRLDDPNDSVRFEVATALKSGKSLMPVLVGGARMPPATALPPDLEQLVHHHAIELDERRWDSDIQHFLTTLVGSSWWQKLLLIVALLLTVFFVGLWIYIGSLNESVTRAESQSIQFRNAFLQKEQIGTDECMAGKWPKGAVKGKTYRENNNSVSELCNGVANTLMYLGRFFDDEALWRLPPSDTTAAKWEDTYKNVFVRDFESWLRDNMPKPPDKDAMILADRAAAEMAIEGQKLLSLKKSAGAAATQIEKTRTVVNFGKVWTFVAGALVFMWTIRRRKSFFR